jgi:predicted dehydrogenase
MADPDGFGELVLLRVHSNSGRTAGYELMELGTHFFDWVRILAGDAHWCFASFTTDGRDSTAADIHRSADEGRPDQRECGPLLGDRGVIQFGMDRGVIAIAEFPQKPHLPRKSDAAGLDLIGTTGQVLLRGFAPCTVWRFRGSYLLLQDGHTYQRVPLPADEYDANGWPPDARALRLRPFAAMHQDLADAIRTGRPVASTGRDGRAALEMVFAAWESHRRQARVTLPLPYRDHPLERWQAEARVAAPRMSGPG